MPIPSVLTPRRRHIASAALACALAACASTPLPPFPAPAAPPPAPAPAAATTTGTNALAADDAALRERFAGWVLAFEQRARAAGISDATLHAAFDDAHPLPKLVQLDRAQPEFTRAPWDYVDAIVSDQRVALGQAKLASVRPAADAAASAYGVPAEIVAGVWGIESNFGGNAGDTPTIDALATLGAEGRREDWARAELMAALKILQSGDIDRARMVGSWAGAMGQTQFLPSSFLAYAVDADGDGRRDIWGSMPDVLASTANFLARCGWRADEPWGVEVRLPDGFDVGRADASLRQPSAQWAAEGVRTFEGAPLPAVADGAILLPAGARGPAFLVGANFRALLRYNNSTSYALAVGLLAQRLSGGPGVQAPWPRELVTLNRSQMQALQTALVAHGFDAGKPDGMLGPATRDALRGYQRGAGLPADGYPTVDLLQRLQADGAPAAP